MVRQQVFILKVSVFKKMRQLKRFTFISMDFILTKQGRQVHFNLNFPETHART